MGCRSVSEASGEIRYNGCRIIRNVVFSSAAITFSVPLRAFLFFFFGYNVYRILGGPQKLNAGPFTGDITSSVPYGQAEVGPL